MSVFHSGFNNLRFVGRYDKLNGGFCEDISVALTGGIHDKYHTQVAKYVSNRTPITNQMANYYVQNLRSAKISVGSVAPNVDELYQIIKIALEQNNIVGCYTDNVTFFIFLQLLKYDIWSKIIYFSLFSIFLAWSAH